MFKSINVIFAFVACLIITASCGVNSNLMLKQAKGTEVNSDEIPLQPTEEYKIAVNDKIAFQLYMNEGEDLIDGTTEISVGANGEFDQAEYVVRNSGQVELPKLGKVDAVGMTVENFEDTLELLYSTEYKNPFVKVQITNQRVIVFPGSGSDAKVVPLTNTNTTLMEVIALAGGIADRGKANTVKLMRNVNGERIVYVMDLSVIEGLKFTDLVVQANDYIYVEPAPELGREILEKVVPLGSLLASLAVLVTLISNL
ncbi:polysaccharide biosynthesis/export family protein [Crocinitomicaceae bacterium]|nr:polysaccharide biosynthesis/export family protein [Crocinitomicaceae bacterium]MDC0257520.1 polysaccharide biosynthesis/export family protein [Crocinitomicaceae bacterium]